MTMTMTMMQDQHQPQQAERRAQHPPASNRAAMIPEKRARRSAPAAAVPRCWVLVLLVLLSPFAARAEDEYSAIIQKYEEEFLVEHDGSLGIASIIQDVDKAAGDLKKVYNWLVDDNDPMERKIDQVEISAYHIRFEDNTTITLQRTELDAYLATQQGNRRSLRMQMSKVNVKTEIMVAGRCRLCWSETFTYNDVNKGGRRLADAYIPSNDELLYGHDQRIQNRPNRFKSVKRAISLVDIAMQSAAEAAEAVANADIKFDNQEKLKKQANKEEKALEQQEEVVEAKIKDLQAKIDNAQSDLGGGGLTQARMEELQGRIVRLTREQRALQDEIEMARAKYQELRRSANKAERQYQQALRRANRLLRKAQQDLDSAEGAKATSEYRAAERALKAAADAAKTLNERLGNSTRRTR